MATLSTRIIDLAVRIATECKGVRTLLNGNASDLSALSTAAKGNLVLSINELKSAVDSIINDASTTSSTQTWSVNKISSKITEALNALTSGAPTALNTLDELASALGDDASFAANITTALGNRVRVDSAAQGLSLQQKQNARTNIDAYGSVEIGNPDTDFVTIFTTGLS